MDVMTTLEILGTITGLTHVWLLAREKIIAWIFGIICVSIYVFIFFQQKLYSDAILNGFYIILNSFGWYNWSRRNAETPTVQVKWLSAQNLTIVIAFILIGTTIWGYFMDIYTDASFAYLDAFTTVASLTAQYLLTQKKIDNWLIYIVVDLVAIPLYAYKGLYVTAGLFSVYLILCIMGYFNWKKELTTPVV